MTCYRPQPALQSYNHLSRTWSRPKILYPENRYADGARVFRRQFGDFSDVRTRHIKQRYITLPCGVCFGCRCDNSRMWSLRMMHEHRYHDHNYFLTLTYSDENLPPGAVLQYRDLQKFWKSARHVFQDPQSPFKYFACGEYGDKSLRPHYHAAVFDFRIPDLRPYKRVGGGWYFLSDALRKCWGHGHVIVADLSWQSAAYIARYVTKKMHGANVRDRGTFDPVTGEVDLFPVERAFQSNGLGKPFYEEFADQIWEKDACLFNGKYLIKPPRYYLKLLADSDPDAALAIKERRQADHAPQFIDFDRDKELLYVMQAKKLHMQTLLSRNL